MFFVYINCPAADHWVSYYIYIFCVHFRISEPLKSHVWSHDLVMGCISKSGRGRRWLWKSVIVGVLTRFLNCSVTLQSPQGCSKFLYILSAYMFRHFASIEKHVVPTHNMRLFVYLCCLCSCPIRATPALRATLSDLGLSPSQTTNDSGRLTKPRFVTHTVTHEIVQLHGVVLNNLMDQAASEKQIMKTTPSLCQDQSTWKQSLTSTTRLQRLMRGKERLKSATNMSKSPLMGMRWLTRIYSLDFSLRPFFCPRPIPLSPVHWAAPALHQRKKRVMVWCLWTSNIALELEKTGLQQTQLSPKKTFEGMTDRMPRPIHLHLFS